MDIYSVTDDESYESWDDDNESETDELTYEPEEPSLTKYNIVLCELYNNQMHGISDDEMNYHYLTRLRLKWLDTDFLTNFSPESKLEIAECIYLPSHHCISILKTIWFKLIQRTWKKIYKERKLIISKRFHPNSLKYREIYGTWPNNCINYPSLKGMLSNLSRASRASSRTSSRAFSRASC
jgi:hypothetical protein